MLTVSHARAFIASTLLGLCVTLPSQSHAQNAQLTLAPAEVEAGSPELIHIDAPPNAHLDGEWLGRKLEFFAAAGSHGWYALAGADVETPVGPSQLIVHIHTPQGPTRDQTLTVDIHAAHYRTGSLTVAPRFVSPDPEALKQIKAEAELKAKVFSSSAPQPLWSGSFRAPVTAEPTDSFGTRRMFNGKLASTHKGMDFRAPSGTTVRAGNSGVVVLARPLYYEGNCVVLDHGQGLYTISMHFSRIDVQEGQRVTTGQPLGLSGATGRVTGPHLHWAVRWRDAYLDPAKLLRMNLDGIR